MQARAKLVFPQPFLEKEKKNLKFFSKFF